jgi:hypothetical protein
MWAVWAGFVVVLAALYVYRASLTKDEEDQIILDDSFDHMRTEQAAIVARVNKIEPVVRVMIWLVALMSAFVIVYYIRDILLQLNIIH